MASGDPRPESVILWTRVDPPNGKGRDVGLRVEVSTREDFAEIVVSAPVKARAQYDHCAKAKVKGLSPATTYYYRFLYDHGGRRHASRTGRTRTAPAPDADVPVRFAFVSCQDFAAGHYNTLLLLAREDLDFVVHLGDYIYETTAQRIPGREVTFEDEEGAIELPGGEAAARAAAALHNYRELYRRYRSDPALQRVHERFPVIAIWDDHEFSNDCYGATGTYWNGRVDETSVPRRKNANQAWFEYQPVDLGDDHFDYDPGASFPGDLSIYRDLRFGRHVHLVLTDLRTYRADHLVPEAGLPGKVVLTHDVLQQDMLGSPPDWAQPYVNVDVPDHTGDYRKYGAALKAAAPLIGYDPAWVEGNIAVSYINQVVQILDETLPATEQIPLIDPSTIIGLGVSFVDIGKLSPYSALGSRYLLGKEAFDLYAWRLAMLADGEAEQVMGPAQEAWFLETLRGSQATWKVWGNEYAFSPLVLDLSEVAGLPEPLQRSYYLNADAWDGFPNRRAALLDALAEIDGVVILTGDAHALFASTLGSTRDPERGVVEIVTPAISSMPLGFALDGSVRLDPELSRIDGATEVAARLEELLTSPGIGANPHLAVARTKVHGYVVVEADGAALTATARLLDPREAEVDQTGKEEALAARVETIRLRTVAGTGGLERASEAGWERWSRGALAWMPPGGEGD
ncbi:MAG TPA: alkaline phosphatase D family protein [Candidatus Nanopelagicales bacterium]|nr:alkaline phosphatase D family protein [Candidatus Nanopelagicales bacterium]